MAAHAAVHENSENILHREFDVVYPATGAPDNRIGANLAELEAWTGGAWADLCK